MGESVTIYRCQDKHGAGPFKPGFSHLWKREPDCLAAMPAIQDEFDLHKVMRGVSAHEQIVTACVTPTDLALWFTSRERAQLALMGFGFYELRADRIVATGKHQVLAASVIPFKRRRVRRLTELDMSALSRVHAHEGSLA